MLLNKFISFRIPKSISISNTIHRWKSPHVSRQIRQFANDAVQSTRDSPVVGYWLAGCSGLVFGAVVLGGVTRLTESGLSMVTWRLLGENRPRSNEEWQREFEKYKEYPEFKIKNKDIDLSEFKRIWWMEYAHRSWGRLIGAAFFLPAGFWWLRGKFSVGTRRRVLISGTLIAAQGLMGWYMVKSGLEDRFQGPSDVPRVSQYRLAAHLGLAFTLYTVLTYSALDIISPAQSLHLMSGIKRLKILSHSCKGMVFLTAMSGAFVAGLDAGLVYNSFPKMGDQWIPDDILALSPSWKNFTENSTTVQFNHRILGLTTWSLATTTWLLSRKCVLPRRLKFAATCLFAAATAQATLGICTLLFYVPTVLAASHQSGSLILMTISIWMAHQLKHIRRLPK